jgi:ABC-type branched-subunit amino acid transport system ATPase component
MIELLGVGVRHRRGDWLVRNVCARLEAGEVTLVVSSHPEERRAVIDAVAANRVPDEGRLWVNHVPLLRATAGRLRRLCGLVELPGRLVGTRSILWNTLAPTSTVRALGGLLRLPRRRDRQAVDLALERVGLRARAHQSAAVLAAPDRLRLLLARALARDPEHLAVSEPDAALSTSELAAFIERLRGIAHGQRLGVMVSVAHAADIWRLVDRLLVLDGGRPIFTGAPDDVESGRVLRAGALTR